MRIKHSTALAQHKKRALKTFLAVLEHLPEVLHEDVIREALAVEDVGES